MSKLGLYIHIPWCIRKCPYCDFNSHLLKEDYQAQHYINALLKDLHYDLSFWKIQRPIDSIFIGGGTPSLLTGPAIQALLTGVFSLIQPSDPQPIEITLEANPNTADQAHLKAYRLAGVNRLSVGVQSFSDTLLTSIGRLHNAKTAIKAVESAKRAGFSNINIDLMYGLPGQSVADALSDIQAAHRLTPQHISWYQLTLEPNTPFHHRPPSGLPTTETLWEMDCAGRAMLHTLGYRQYEISAFCKPSYTCSHNLNYWEFGDYLGIGAGAHGKITTATNDSGFTVHRYFKHKHPKHYLNAFLSYNNQTAHATDYQPYCQNSQTVKANDLIIEFLMNRLRLMQAISHTDFRQKTGQSFDNIQPALQAARKMGLISKKPDIIKLTKKGKCHLNTVLQLLL